MFSSCSNDFTRDAKNSRLAFFSEELPQVKEEIAAALLVGSLSG
jgi:hypothetical protein